MEKQGKLASLWKLQEYYAAANQFEKMKSVMTQIEAMTDKLTQRNEEPDDEIMIDGDGKDDVKLDHGDSENNDDVYEESSDSQELVDNSEEEEEKRGSKHLEKPIIQIQRKKNLATNKATNKVAKIITLRFVSSMSFSILFTFRNLT